MAVFSKKTWQNRLSEHPTRRMLTDTVGGGTQLVEVSREEGEIYQAGDGFTADNMNDLETRVKTAFDSLETSFSNALTALKNTAIAQAVGATGTTFTSVIAKLAQIPVRTNVSKTIQPGATESLPAGYYKNDHSVSVAAETGTYGPITTNGTHDMGATNANRYVNVAVPPYIAYYDEWHDTGIIPDGRQGMNMGFSVTNGALYVVARWVAYSSEGDAWQRASFSGGDIIQDLSVRDTSVASCRMWIVRATSTYFSYNCSVNDSAGARRMVAIRIG